MQSLKPGALGLVGGQGLLGRSAIAFDLFCAVVALAALLRRGSATAEGAPA